MSQFHTGVDKAPVQAFDEAVLLRLSGRNVVPLDTALLIPDDVGQDFRDELGR